MCPQPPARALGSHPRESRRVPLTSPGGPGHAPTHHTTPPPPHPQQNHKTQMALEGREEAAASTPLHRLPRPTTRAAGGPGFLMVSTPAPGPRSIRRPEKTERGTRGCGGARRGRGVGEGDAASRKGVTLLNWQLSTSVHFTSTKRNTWISSLLRGA